MLYSDSYGCFLIGCLCNRPELLRSGKYPLTPDDFSPNLLHKHLFAVINNLAMQGLNDITEVEVGIFIEPYETTKEIIYEQDGLGFIKTVKTQAHEENIDLYYNVIRKFSLLRIAVSEGIDVSDIYDERKSQESQMKKLNEYTPTQLIEHFEAKIINLKSVFNNNSVIPKMWLGDSFETVLKELQSTPAMGAGLCSSYETTIFRGWQQGHLLMRSAPSGLGKTLRSIGDLCNVCIPYLFDVKQNEFVKNPNYQGKGVFIHTELNQEYEIQPRFLSYICNIPFHKILDGQLTTEENNRLLESVELIKNNIKLIDIANFTIPMLRDTLKEVAVVDGCTHGVFDYVQDNGVVSKHYKNETGTGLRQDMVLLAIVTDLKACAEEYNMGLLTMTQLNGNEKTAAVIDESCLFGSKSMKNKIDGGTIMLAPSLTETEQTSTLQNKTQYENLKPNVVSHVYKGRFSKYGQNLKIFQYMDYATGRIADFYVTNQYNEPIHVEKTKVCNVLNGEQ